MSIAPLLNVAKSLAPSLLLKGITRINPKFKNFFTEAAAYGYSAEQALDYLKDRFSPDSQFQNDLNRRESTGTARPDESAALTQINNQQIPGKVARSALAYGGAAGSSLLGEEEPVQQPTVQQPVQQPPGQQPPVQPPQPPRGGNLVADLISQFPELGKFLDDQIGKGVSILQAITEAKKSKLLSPIIKRIETVTGHPLEVSLAPLYGGQTKQNASSSKRDQIKQMIAAFKARK